MLKIKDNVDLNELRKFGFDYIPPRDKYQYHGSDDFWFNIDEDDRLIEKPFFDDNCWSIDDAQQDYVELIFELTKAGLVEKVGE